jgi:hypothetical protein
MHRPGLISIWYFIGILLLIYGVLITGSGLYEFVAPPARTVVHAELHAAVWWGAILLVLGAVYTYRFSPRRQKR